MFTRPGAMSVMVPPVHVHLCGVRGSTPTPGTHHAGVGGNTSCVAIADDGRPPTLLIDAGTGLSSVARLLSGEPYRGTILLSHLHWDHIMGLPFFPPGDRPDAEVQLLLPEQGMDPVEVLTKAMGPPLFPITPHQLRGKWQFGTYGEGKFEASGFSVITREIPHKGGRTMGLRISDGRATIAYLSDHSPHSLGPGADGLGELHPAAVELASGVDVLFHDAQYTVEELPARATWGHAAAKYGATLAEHCGAGRLVMFHHDPMRTDDQVWAMRDELAAATSVPVEVAVEGVVIQL